jgi:hypothetical protein
VQNRPLAPTAARQRPEINLYGAKSTVGPASLSLTAAVFNRYA